MSGGPQAVRNRMIAIDMEGNKSTMVTTADGETIPSIVVGACADVLKCGTVNIPVSSDERYRPRNVKNIFSNLK